MRFGDHDAGFFKHLACHSIFEALARFDEARDGRIAPRRPARLTTEQGAFAVADEHDDRRIDARKKICRAVGRHATHDVSGAMRRGRCTADPTTSMPVLPVGEGAGVGQQTRFSRLQFRGQRPQLLEAHVGWRGHCGIELHQHATNVAKPAEQDQRFGCRRLHQGVLGRDEGGRRRLAADGQFRAAYEQVPGAGIATRVVQPVLDLAQFRAPVDVRTCEKIAILGGVRSGHAVRSFAPFGHRVETRALSAVEHPGF